MFRVSCAFCEVSCPSPRSLCQHVAGQKHRAVMSLVSPEKQEQYERVQYFVDTYLKAYPVLGLDCVVEEQVGSSYHYTCTLCNKSCGWQEMVGHVTGIGHTKLYVRKHHRKMKTKCTDLTKEEENALLMKVAQTICTKFGHGKICVKDSNASNPDVVAVPSPIEDIKNNCPLPSTGNGLQTEHTKERLPLDSVPQEKGSHVKTIKAKFQGYTCFHCKITCSSALTLCQHIIGSKHKQKLRSPRERDDANRLSSFLNVHMKEDPVVGLEYVMEIKQGSLYKFSCRLCGVLHVDLMKIVGHITDLNHIERYAWKHYGDMFPPVVPGIRKIACAKVLRDISVRIIKRQKKKRKKIQVINTTVGGLTESALFPVSDSKTRKSVEDRLPSKPEGDRKTRKAFEDTLPSKHKSRSSHSKWKPSSYREKGLDESHESYRYSKMPKVSKSDNPPLAKRRRLSPEGDWDSLPSRSHISKHRSSHYESQAIRMDCTTAVQELEFRTNEEFFNYLSNFVISNDEDAVFIRTITQNCIRAITNF